MFSVIIFALTLNKVVDYIGLTIIEPEKVLIKEEYEKVLLKRLEIMKALKKELAETPVKSK